MFHAAGVDALTGLALIFAAVLLSLVSGLVHLFWQLATKTTRIGWRSLTTSSVAVAGAIGLIQSVADGVKSLSVTGIIVLLALGSLFAGGLVGRTAGVVVRIIADKSGRRGYY